MLPLSASKPPDTLGDGFSPIGPDVSDEHHQHREQPSGFGIDPKDGMPRPLAMTNLDLTKAPPLDPDTFVCMADRRRFVVRGDDGVLCTLEPEQIDRTTDTPSVKVDSLNAEQREALRLGRHVTIEPVRVACEHYARLKTDFMQDPDHRLYMRMCLAQRSETGEYISLQNTRVHACTLRQPRDLPSEQQLDDFDDELTQRKPREEFDIDAELSKHDLGILNGDRHE